MRDFSSTTRRVVLVAAAALSLAACNQGGGKIAEGDMAMGAPDGAKVTVVEYASVTCHVCAAWQEENWAAFKARYIDTNKVRYVFREIPTPPANAAVAGFLIARCAGEDKYFDVVHQIMASQDEWRAGVEPRETLFRVGKAAGLSDARIQQCITDPEAVKAVEERAAAARAAGVTGTPTFFVNGQQIISPGSSSGPSLTDIAAVIDAELAKG